MQVPKHIYGSVAISNPNILFYGRFSADKKRKKAENRLSVPFKIFNLEMHTEDLTGPMAEVGTHLYGNIE
jgi:hypothetical protein